MSNSPEIPQGGAKFPVGTAVRVKTGITDPDFADIPLGGWAGTVQQIDAATYLVKWNQDTIDQMTPVYNKRCERDGLEMETMWMEENDLEFDTGQPTNIERPTALVKGPLSRNNQVDRIRAIFGLTSDDPLRVATDENMRRYHRYLTTHLTFPFQAQYIVETGPLAMEKECPVTITKLLDLEDDDATEGLLCEGVEDNEPIELPLADLEGSNNAENRELIEDYAYWFTNFEYAESQGAEVFPGLPFIPPSFLPKISISFTVVLVVVLVSGAGIGSVLGSLLASMELARILAVAGAVLLGILGWKAGSKLGLVLGRLNQVKAGSFSGGILGVLGGVMAGALLGAMFVAIVGLFVGGAVGAILSELVLGGKRRALAGFFGAMLGATAQAFMVDQEQALVGAIYGGAIGAFAALLTIVGLKKLVARKSTWVTRRALSEATLKKKTTWQMERHLDGTTSRGF